MKQLLLILILLSINCFKPKQQPQNLLIVDVYKTVEGYWITVIELENEARSTMFGKYGIPGDTLKCMVYDKHFKKFGPFVEGE